MVVYKAEFPGDKNIWKLQGIINGVKTIVCKFPCVVMNISYFHEKNGVEHEECFDIYWYDKRILRFVQNLQAGAEVRISCRIVMEAEKMKAIGVNCKNLTATEARSRRIVAISQEKNGDKDGFCSISDE